MRNERICILSSAILIILVAIGGACYGCMNHMIFPFPVLSVVLLLLAVGLMRWISLCRKALLVMLYLWIGVISAVSVPVFLRNVKVLFHPAMLLNYGVPVIVICLLSFKGVKEAFVKNNEQQK